MCKFIINLHWQFCRSPNRPWLKKSARSGTVSMVTSSGECNFSSWSSVGELWQVYIVIFVISEETVKIYTPKTLFDWTIIIESERHLSCPSPRSSSHCMIVSGSAPSLCPSITFIPVNPFEHPGQASRPRMATWQQRWETPSHNLISAPAVFIRTVFIRYLLNRRHFDGLNLGWRSRDVTGTRE